VIALAAAVIAIDSGIGTVIAAAMGRRAMLGATAQAAVKARDHAIHAAIGRLAIMRAAAPHRALINLGRKARGRMRREAIRLAATKRLGKTKRRGKTRLPGKSRRPAEMNSHAIPIGKAASSAPPAKGRDAAGDGEAVADVRAVATPPIRRAVPARVAERTLAAMPIARTAHRAKRFLDRKMLPDKTALRAWTRRRDRIPRRGIPLHDPRRLRLSLSRQRAPKRLRRHLPRRLLARHQAPPHLVRRSLPRPPPVASRSTWCGRRPRARCRAAAPRKVRTPTLS
jgi:hypothetical protein